MFQEIEFIKKNSTVTVVPLNKGWLKDQKYILEDNNGIKYLLRISDKSLYEKKKKQFELIKQIEKLDIYCSKPIEFGLLENGNIYMILSYLEGLDGKDALKEMSNKEAYILGIEAGEILKKIHGISIPKQNVHWFDLYKNKAERKIKALLSCEYKIPRQNEIIKYYLDNMELMKNRPMSLTHGDYHLGNMIVNNGKLGIIDFDRGSITDPYDDFKPLCWNVMANEYFETGLLNGYFKNNIPNDFFKILKFYVAENLITHLPWAVAFGDEEIKTALKVADYQMLWYDNFKLEVPIWYKGMLKF